MGAEEENPRQPSWGEPFRQKNRTLTGLWKAGNSSEGARS